ncbi:HNH endonuclease [Paramixta manurensis]|uniref:HNH endonuclease n=1 Tax=Paramixta manurensis TaxID=2740817 RepID=A0A6M8UE64_9GAMM|nr:HNH endonuclease [Erwiniaceae bacterium PD-1]
MKIIPSKDILEKFINYEPETGVFIWKVSPSPRVNIGDRSGWLDSQGYRYIRIENKTYKSSRLAYLWMTGNQPVIVDHINGIRSDDRWENLRNCLGDENNYNKGKESKNKSGITGVFWSSRDKKWRAEITHQGKRKSLGYYEDLFSASCARRSAEITYFGDYRPTRK